MLKKGNGHTRMPCPPQAQGPYLHPAGRDPPTLRF